MNKIGYLTMEKYDNRRTNSVGSSRIRGRWVYKYDNRIVEFKNGVPYDAVIYQKAYWREHMAEYRGIKIFDLCDPDWLEGRPISETATLVDGFTVTTQAIADYLAKLTDKPIRIIPDRIDMEEHYPQKENHIGRARSVVWFGYAGNQDILARTADLLRSKRLHLVVISDRPYAGAEVNIKYDYATINQEIVKHDAVFLPTDAKNIKSKYKSNNKVLTAWALKMPVIREFEDLDLILDPDYRNKEAERRYKEVEQEYNVRSSGPEYVEFINEIRKNKGGETQI